MPHNLRKNVKQTAAHKVASNILPALFNAQVKKGKGKKEEKMKKKEKKRGGGPNATTNCQLQCSIVSAS